MDYELCEELKNAGFPQMMPDIDRFGNRRYINPTGEIEDAVFTPTLSELIEACGGRGSFELKESEFFISGKWFAGLITRNTALEDFDNAKEFKAYGPSPEEAVARLWLALNKK